MESVRLSKSLKLIRAAYSSRVAGDLRSPVSRFRLTNGGPRYSAVVKQHVPQGREKERERLLVRRIVENKAMDLDLPPVFKVLGADWMSYVC